MVGWMLRILRSRKLAKGGDRNVLMEGTTPMWAIFFFLIIFILDDSPLFFIHIFFFSSYLFDRDLSNSSMNIFFFLSIFKDDVMHVIVKIRVPLLRVKSDYQLMGKVGQELVRGRGQLNGNFCKYIHSCKKEIEIVTLGRVLIEYITLVVICSWCGWWFHCRIEENQRAGRVDCSSSEEQIKRHEAECFSSGDGRRGAGEVDSQQWWVLCKLNR